MRNVLVFPDNYELDFTYPSDRTLEEGTRLYVRMSDSTTNLVEITNISQQESAIYYYLILI
ncbi:hypothetical protein BN990_04276 [Virgibacillus salexigens]|uniref:Uncharacterized protein n=1 Tax=Virgibacillus massiliensis TaxID=1462526 RepID=A0A024QI36_9BACI|nr:hypothetical protein BN990_04276 [Virgibacillus massiliensis]